MIILTLISTMMTASLMFSTNPVKSSILILILSISMFFTISIFSGSSWLPYLLTMLFTGGIIMMFMILSSVLPNEKTVKPKSVKVFLYCALIFYPASQLVSKTGEMSEISKNFISSGTNFYVMVTLVLLYFLSSMMTIASEMTPMRTLLCYKDLIL